MSHRLTIIGPLLFLGCVSLCTAERPNVLFIIADDASRHFGKAYHCDWVRTPNIDKLAERGLVFDNAYVPTSKCGPCRSALITGRNPWQLGAAANHQAAFPPEHKVFTEILTERGVACGAKGKVWGPGIAVDRDGNRRTFALDTYSKGGLGGFLDTIGDKPFFFWYGSSNPHRGYRKDGGVNAGKALSDIDRVPGYWPDNEVIRGDMLDYSMEIEAFDGEVGKCLATLKEKGRADNTIVIVTSDHGMPFPRVKGHTFDDAHRVPLVVHWPGRVGSIKRVADLVTLTDLAPTLFDIFGIESGMEFSGHSFFDLFEGQPERERPYVLIGRERNDIKCRAGFPSGAGYPARGIRMDDYLYVYNFKPDRWPCGDPEIGLKDTDPSPTKTFINEPGRGDRYWEHNFGKRPATMLFNVKDDPDCMTNLAGMLAEVEQRFHDTLMHALKEQQDPRVTGSGDVFDNYRDGKNRKAKKRK